jgi:stage II sporulation protein D
VGPSKIFSTALSAKDRGGQIRFKGSGWGHGVGMCQYGAQGMAESGYQWYQILRHYYPGVEFVKVYG